MINFVLADEGEELTGINYGKETGLGEENPIIIVAKIIRIVLGFLGIIGLSLIIYAGFLWMTSNGESTKVEKAKGVLKGAVIGIIIIFSSFAIVSFVLNKLLGGGGGSGGGGGIGGNGSFNFSGGYGILGAGIIERVYPIPGQTDVPRNTSIIVTFREEIKASSICADTTSEGKCVAGSAIAGNNVRIFKTDENYACSIVNPRDCKSLYDAVVFSKDNKTFVFTTKKYLGSATGKIWHSVLLTSAIKKADGASAFKSFNTGFLWQFEVSDKLDLDPPRIENIFPPADNERDEAGTVSSAIQAHGSIAVNLSGGSLKSYSSASILKITPNGSSPIVQALLSPNCSENGNLTMAIASDGIPLLSKGSISLGSGKYNNSKKEVYFDVCNFKFILNSGQFNSGNSWTILVSPEIQPDKIVIGGIEYFFGSENNISKRTIAISSNQLVQASNIVSVINSDAFVSAFASGNIVNIIARQAGAIGNNIKIETSDNAKLVVTAMSDGKDREGTSKIKSRKDKPRNSTIQINFNETMNPLVLSGSSDELKDIIKIINIKTGSIISGKFVMSNQYRTVEFISDNKCSVNSCGKDIYCLPENSEIKVWIKTATLASCGTDNCASRAPFNQCVSGHCRDGNKNYPLASDLNGVVDIAMNSLDGNSNLNAEGPISDFLVNELLGYCVSGDGNGKACDIENAISVCGRQDLCSSASSWEVARAKGDNFSWKFFISDVLDVSSPIISYTKQEKTSGGFLDFTSSKSGAGLSKPILIGFNKLMLFSSLTSGEIFDGSSKHKLLNLWSHGGQAVGYWGGGNQMETGIPDGEADFTEAFIAHTDFADNVTYRTQIGSGIRDIYQNCYKPCLGPTGTCISGCNLANPSCCDGTPTAGDKCQ